MHFERQVRGFGKSAQVTRELAERGAAIAGLDGLHGDAEFGGVGDELRQRLNLSAEGDNLRLVAGLESGNAASAPGPWLATRRSAARMLKEWSTAMTRTFLPSTAEGSRLMNGLAKSSASSISISARSANSRMCSRRRCFTELFSRFSKNISEGNRRGSVLWRLEEMDPDRQADRGNSGKEPWGEETHLEFPFADGQIFAQRVVQRAAGVDQEIIHAGRLGAGAGCLPCGLESWPVFVRE